MLLLPLLSDLLLLDHDSVGSLLVGFVPLFHLKKLVLQVGHFHIALIIELVDAGVEDNLEAVELGDR